MNKLSELRKIIEERKFPNDSPEFGGANLIITKDRDRNYGSSDVVVYSEHASSLSWLVFELKEIYADELDYQNKYFFYPFIGEVINRTLVKQDMIQETMLTVIDEIEKKWGTK